MKKAISIGIATLFLATGFTGYQTYQMGNKIRNLNQQMSETQKNTDENFSRLKKYISTFEEQDKQWTEKQIQKMISQYQEQDQQWTKDKFEESINGQELEMALNSTYNIFVNHFYKTEKGELIKSPYSQGGSSILLNGGYILTANHIVRDMPDPIYPIRVHGMLKYDHSEIFINKNIITLEMLAKKQVHSIEKIITNDKLDYALLKLKEDIDLPCYKPGLNFTSTDLAKDEKNRINIEMLSIGFPSLANKTFKRGNIAQEKSLTKDLFAIYNGVVQGDSGGPIMTIVDGSLNYSGISQRIQSIPDRNSINPRFPILHSTHLGYGLKISSIIKDMEDQLFTPRQRLDQKTTEELKNFLKLNMKHPVSTSPPVMLEPEIE